MVFQGVADSESRFVFIDKGAYGKQSDGDTFSAFTFCFFLEDFESPLPNMQVLRKVEQKCPSSSLVMRHIF